MALAQFATGRPILRDNLMNTSKATAIALAAVASLAGCISRSVIAPVGETVTEFTGIGEPFEFKTEREPLVGLAAADELRTLTFADSIRLALRHDAGIQSALARVRQAQAESDQTRLLPNPILSLAVRLPEGGGKPIVEAGIAADLLSLLFRPGRIAASDQRLRKSSAEALIVVLDTLSEVQRQYTLVQSLNAQVAIDESRRQTLGDLLKVTEARVKAGEGARLDILTVQSELANLDTELMSRRSQERQARITLARLIGQPTSEAAWTLEAWTLPADVSEDESSWIRLALAKRPEIAVVTWELAALGDDLRVAKFGLLDGGEVGIEAERDGDWSVGPAVAVPLPLFDMGTVERERIRARIIEQRHELTTAERLVVQEVRIAIESLRSAKLSLTEVTNRLLPLQLERLEQARNAYRLGLADVLAVRLAEQDLQQAKSQQIELQASVSQALIQLQRAVGGSTLANATTRPTTTQNTTTKPTEY
jgi:outer membrane protein TolC